MVRVAFNQEQQEKGVCGREGRESLALEEEKTRLTSWVTKRTNDEKKFLSI